MNAPEALAELRAGGYTLSVKNRVDTSEHRVGPQRITRADRLLVDGPRAVPEDLRQAIRAHRDELLAAACVMNPPIPWLQTAVGRYRDGALPLSVLAANVASFIGLHPAHDGPRLQPIIRLAGKAGGGDAPPFTPDFTGHRETSDNEGGESKAMVEASWDTERAADLARQAYRYVARTFPPAAPYGPLAAADEEVVRAAAGEDFAAYEESLRELCRTALRAAAARRGAA